MTRNPLITHALLWLDLLVVRDVAHAWRTIATPLPGQLKGECIADPHPGKLPPRLAPRALASLKSLIFNSCRLTTGGDWIPGFARRRLSPGFYYAGKFL